MLFDFGLKASLVDFACCSPIPETTHFVTLVALALENLYFFAEPSELEELDEDVRIRLIRTRPRTHHSE